jgi:predicted Kef-type K+ transport protein
MYDYFKPPFGDAFTIVLLYTLAQLGGRLSEYLGLPPLYGMVIVGFCMQFIPAGYSPS